MAAFMLLVRWNIGRKPAGVWHGLDFTAADSFTVRPVENDSGCPQYFFDSTLKMVLFPCKDGFADC